MASKRKSMVVSQRPRKLLGEMARQVGCQMVSLGDVEQLAGVDIKSEAERRELWAKFSHLFGGPNQVLIDAVMDYCSEIAIGRIQAGDLCLVKTRYC